MKSVKLFQSAAVLSILLCAAACSTGYKSEGIAGGYSETQLSETVYRVNFSGNGYTSLEKSSDFMLLRAAEIGLEKGFTHFAVVENSEGISTSYDAPDYNCSAIGNNLNCRSHGRGSARKPRTASIVQYFKGKPTHPKGAVYETKFVFRSISEKYGLNQDVAR